MHAQTCIANVALVSDDGRFRAFRALHRRLFKNVLIWCKRRQAIRQLRELDDHVLEDIGIHRSEITPVVNLRYADLSRQRRTGDRTGSTCYSGKATS